MQTAADSKLGQTANTSADHQEATVTQENLLVCCIGLLFMAAVGLTQYYVANAA